MSEIERLEFWGRVARRINDVLRASRDNNMRFLWVDDIIAPTLPLQKLEASTITIAFVSEDDGKSFVQYRVSLSLSEEAVAAYCKGEWSRILPEPDAIDWFTISRANKEIKINIVL
jgi:hypothetical protein